MIYYRIVVVGVLQRMLDNESAIMVEVNIY